jgi:hypothetical protein
MRNKRYVGVLAAAALALLTPNASAFSNVAVGDTGTATLVSSTLAIGSFSSCTGSTWSLVATQDNGPGAGGTFSIPAASLTGCTAFGSATTFTPDTTTPWTLAVNGAGTATISGVNFVEHWGTITCRYQGTIYGAYNQTNGNMVLSGNVSRVSGSSLCPTPTAINGTYNIRNAGNVPVLL